MRLPQQTIPLSRAPYSDPTGALRDVESYSAQATDERNVVWHVEIPGRPPTQRDRDVLEMLFAVGEPIAMDGTIGYRLEAYGFLRRLAYAHPGERDVMWLRDVLRRWIRPISLTATDGSAWRDFAIVMDAKAARVGHGKDTRWVVAVVLSPAYVEMLTKDMHLSYHSLVPQIVALPSDLAKAIVRTMLGHRWRHRTLRDILCDLGVRVTDLTDRTLRRYRAAILAAADQLAGLGIRVVETGAGLDGVALHLDAQPDGVYTAAPLRSPVADLLGLPVPSSADTLYDSCGQSVRHPGHAIRHHGQSLRHPQRQKTVAKTV